MSCIGMQTLYHWATREALKSLYNKPPSCPLFRFSLCRWSQLQGSEGERQHRRITAPQLSVCSVALRTAMAPTKIIRRERYDYNFSIWHICLLLLPEISPFLLWTLLKESTWGKVIWKKTFMFLLSSDMLFNCGVEEDSWASLGLQGDQISQS